MYQSILFFLKIFQDSSCSWTYGPYFVWSFAISCSATLGHFAIKQLPSSLGWSKIWNIHLTTLLISIYRHVFYASSKPNHLTNHLNFDHVLYIQMPPNYPPLFFLRKFLLPAFLISFLFAAVLIIAFVLHQW